jgi:hypothetical protein
MAKRFLVPHWHASTAGMGALIRTAIGIINKRNGMKDRESKKGKQRQRKAKVIIVNISTF